MLECLQNIRKNLPRNVRKDAGDSAEYREFPTHFGRVGNPTWGTSVGEGRREVWWGGGTSPPCLSAGYGPGNSFCASMHNDGPVACMRPSPVIINLETTEGAAC